MSDTPHPHQGPALSPLKESPVRSKEEPSKSPEEPRRRDITTTLRVSLLTTAWHEQLLFRLIITDGRQAEDFTNAQVTKVANSGTETKPAPEETSQMPKKVRKAWLKLSFVI